MEGEKTSQQCSDQVEYSPIDLSIIHNNIHTMAAADSSVCKDCPAGWHNPSNAADEQVLSRDDYTLDDSKDSPSV